MSTLTLLPLLRVADGVQTNEDWQLSLAFYLSDGVTPIPLDGLTFTVNVGILASYGTGDGHIAVSGPSDNVLVITVLASEKASWPTGVYALLLSASDGQYTRDLFASSTLSVGSAQSARVSLAVSPDPVPQSVVAPLPAALATALQAIQPNAIALALATADLAALAQALFAAIPVQQGATPPVLTGQAFVNNSGYVVIAQ